MPNAKQTERTVIQVRNAEPDARPPAIRSHARRADTRAAFIHANARPIIQAERLEKTFSQDVHVLSAVDLLIREGEFVSLVGRSGTGKSTLINLIIGNEHPTAGRLFVNGWNVSLLRRRHLPFFRRQLGIVFQNYRLLPKKTVFENVAFALVVQGASHRRIVEEVPRVLALVGLAGKEERFPHELSGGEQQRVAIARAFVHRPKLLVADEPTGNLDALYAWEIIEVLLKINELGATILLATHDRDIVNRLHRRVITLDSGRVIRDQAEGEYVI